MEAPHLISFGGKAPRIDPGAFVAPGAQLIGDIEIAPEASIWYNCVLRGDVNRIRIGAPWVVALTVQENTASWGLMERLGMIRRPDLDYDGPHWADGRAIVYRIERDQWKARTS